MTAPAPELMKLYNLPQRVEGGIPIHGLKDDKDKDIVVRFHHLDGMYSYCTVEGKDGVLNLSANTPIVYEDGKYSVAEEEASDESA